MNEKPKKPERPESLGKYALPKILSYPELWARWVFYSFQACKLLRLTFEVSAASLIIWGVLLELSSHKTDRVVNQQKLFTQLTQIKTLPAGIRQTWLRTNVEALARGLIYNFSQVP